MVLGDDSSKASGVSLPHSRHENFEMHADRSTKADQSSSGDSGSGGYGSQQGGDSGSEKVTAVTNKAVTSNRKE